MSADGAKNSGEPHGAGRLFVEAVLWANAFLGGVVALVAGVLLAQFAPTTRIPVWAAATAGVIVSTLIAALVRALLAATDAARRIFAERERDLPRATVKSISKPYPPYDHCRCVLIVEWSGSAVLPQGCTVVVSIAEEHHERPLGYGTVRARQSDGKAVVTLDSPYGGVDDYLVQVLDTGKQATFLPRIRLGGSIVAEHFEAVRQHATTNPAGGTAIPASQTRDHKGS